MNHNRTKVGEKDPEGKIVGDRGAEANIKHIYFVTNVMWDSNAIGDIAKKNGIKTIYYADIETFVILDILSYIFIGPVWHQYTVHIYGK